MTTTRNRPAAAQPPPRKRPRARRHWPPASKRAGTAGASATAALPRRRRHRGRVIHPASSPDLIFREIIQGLYKGIYVPGQRLVEVDLTQKWGVSRGTVREALNRLAAEGIVVLSRHRGAAIRVLDLAEMQDILAVLEMMIGMAARLAAQRIGKAPTAHASPKTSRRCWASAAVPNSIDLVRARNRFYRTLAAIGGNKELDVLLSRMHVHLLRVQLRALHVQTGYRAVRRLRPHRRCRAGRRCAPCGTRGTAPCPGDDRGAEQRAHIAPVTEQLILTNIAARVLKLPKLSLRLTGPGAGQGGRNMKAFTFATIAVLACVSLALPAKAQDVKLGVLTDLGGPYSDASGQGAVVATQMAVEDLKDKLGNRRVEVISADHQSKPDVGAAIARRWLDTEGVDAIVNVPNSAIALAVQTRHARPQEDLPDHRRRHRGTDRQAVLALLGALDRRHLQPVHRHDAGDDGARRRATHGF